MNVLWYVKRLGRMTPAEVTWRIRDELVRHRWRQRWRRGTAQVAAVVEPDAPGISAIPATAAGSVSSVACARLIAAADALLDGHWPVFSRLRRDMMPAPDWFLDPKTGVRAPERQFCFDIEHRDEEQVGNIKYVWETSRHHHVTVLATAWHVTREDRYAQAVADQLAEWWRSNPFLTGIHWTSGIELGIRLLSWVWSRRLLAEWTGVADLFDDNPLFRQQLRDHQAWLAAFPSRGTSANNHIIAELAGQFAAACAFPWFPESPQWRAVSAEGLARELPRQTFESGLNRELATAYHGLVLELGLAAAIEGEAGGHPLDDAVWGTLLRMSDALAAIVDVAGRPPRQGDDDEGHALIVDAPTYDRWSSLLATSATLFGARPWWPRFDVDDVRTPLLTSLVATPVRPRAGRPAERPLLLADAGLAILTDRDGTADELWCRLDGGPHGYLQIAAHAHADALSIEARVGGVDVLADPGTYCYHGDRRWRDWFRSTRAHNTLEIGGVDQSVSGGPFLWTRHACTTVEGVRGLTTGPVAEWQGIHDGYRRLRPAVTHRRNVRLDRRRRGLKITDTMLADEPADHPCRLSYHLGPSVACELDGAVAQLSWKALDGDLRRATLHLPDTFRWEAHRGRDDAPDGWFSPSFDLRLPAVVLVGTGSLTAETPITTEFLLDDLSLPSVGSAYQTSELRIEGRR